MVFEYTTLYSRTPRSFLFSVVANVGPGGASRSLVVAYRQHHDKYNSAGSWPRVRHMVTDTLALIEILSDPANRAPLEAERSLAEDWYRRSQGGNDPHVNERPSVPDTAQPPFVPWNKHAEPVQPHPQLPWRDDTLSQFPFTATCVLLALLRDDSDDNATDRNRTRPGDVQLQPLSTVFRADCTEYGLVILDVSDLDSGVKYGIVAFPVRYMAEVWCRCEGISWDPVEDDQPVKEPDVVLDSPRPRVLLSIAQWLREYYYSFGQDNPSILKLEERPLVNAAALDYIWPQELDDPAREEDPTHVEDPARVSSKGVLSHILKYFGPSKTDTRIKNVSTTRSPSDMVGYIILDEPPLDESTIKASSITILDEPPQYAPIDMDRAINDLLILTQEPASLPLDKRALANVQILAQFREKLRQRLKEVPDKLDFSKISSYILRVAYAGCSHLNWVAFRNLPPRVIATAVVSDELRGASALSLCVDRFQGESELGDLAAALARSTALQQLCFLQRPDREKDDTSARFCSQLLQLWGRASEREDLGWLRLKTIYSTSALSTCLRSREFLTSSSTISSSFTSSGAQVFPKIHLFTFVDSKREDVPNATANHYFHRSSPGYSGYYSMDNTLLTAERFAVRFLAYLRSLGSDSDPDKAILRFAYNGPCSLLAPVDDDDHSPLPRSSPDRFGVSPIPAGFFDYELTLNDPSRVRLRDIPPGAWVVLVNRRDRSCRLSKDDAFLQYSFVRIRRTSAEIAPEQQQQRPAPVPNSVEVVGGLADFLRETVLEIDISTWEEQVVELKRDLHTRRASIGTGERCIDVRVMTESWAHTLLNQLL
ncbi:hypothetical protein BJX96DRAFT_171371 [Aspergillus floccosus]